MRTPQNMKFIEYYQDYTEYIYQNMNFFIGQQLIHRKVCKVRENS
jgi:hypothetical protein